MSRAAAAGGAKGAEPSCWLRSSLDLIDYAERRGASRARLLALLPREVVARPDPERRIPIGSYYAVVEAVAQALRDPLFGISYIEQVQPAAIDALGFLAAASRTLGEALTHITRHLRWISPGEHFDFTVEGDAVSFRYQPWGPARPAHDWLAQMYAADCMVLTPRSTGAPVQVLAFSLRQAALAPPADYRRRLGALPRFQAAENEWRMPAEVLARTMPGADPGLVQFFSRYLAQQAAPQSAPQPDDASQLLVQLRQWVCESLPDGVPSLQRLARQADLSKRTLQRRLAAEGTQLAAMVESLRRSRAEAFLQMGLTATEAAQLLGYADPAAFHRAFRRWTGISPGAWRHQFSAAPGASAAPVEPAA